MTRKDYIAIAEALRYARGHAVGAGPVGFPIALDAVMAAAEYIANAMENDNPRFDRKHFLAVVRGERTLTSKPKRDLAFEIGKGLNTGS